MSRRRSDLWRHSSSIATQTLVVGWHVIFVASSSGTVCIYPSFSLAFFSRRTPIERDWLYRKSSRSGPLDWDQWTVNISSAWVLTNSASSEKYALSPIAFLVLGYIPNKKPTLYSVDFQWNCVIGRTDFDCHRTTVSNLPGLFADSKYARVHNLWYASGSNVNLILLLTSYIAHFVM